MSRMFGTDGVRGVANDELTPQLAMQLGQAGACVLTRANAHQPTIMVGCDTRISGDMLANALMAGACSVGANCVYVGVMPTPAIAYLTKKYRVDAGVVISASHNPMEFNGIKFFEKRDGIKEIGAELQDKLVKAHSMVSTMDDHSVIQQCISLGIKVDTMDVSELRKNLIKKRAEDMLAHERRIQRKVVDDFSDFKNGNLPGPEAYNSVRV